MRSLIIVSEWADPVVINRNSPIPLYHQLKQILVSQIESGTFALGDMLPTEEEICEQFHVSRTTVRQALDDLVQEGRVQRFRGRGSFVARPRPEPESYPSLSDHLLMKGIRPGWRLLSVEWLEASHELCRQLHLQPGQKVYCIRRLRLENEEPVGYHKTYVSPAFFSEIEETNFEEGGSLHYLSGHDLLDSCYANRVLEAVSAGPEEASLLHVPTGSAMFVVRRVVFTRDHHPVEVFRGVYRGDRFQYYINNMRALSLINA